MIALPSILLISMIPAFAALLGGTTGYLYKPEGQWLSILQHFVAGILIAAVSLDLLPQVTSSHQPFLVSLFFILGVVIIFAVEHGIHHLMDQKQSGLILGAALDLLVDGLLIGFSFVGGFKSGLLIAISLSFCAFFLSLTVVSTIKRGRIAVLLLLACMLPLGTVIGSFIASKVLLEVLSMAVAALLYLGIEGLLCQAHRKNEKSWVSFSFFLGFILVLTFQQGV
ncbi:MAG: hypothetical protein S4CHLAM81_02220 [Chlamydiales bacterium]|nr:hypothetical protein [Chlamydiales bacterium]MCH9635014.1 hypothetical protein [Chlamydiales bacterium]MCH9704282.1 hypothetical protein [Chlamydiota bacterium]